MGPRAVEFFDDQFRRQAASGDYALNPFEQWALPHLRGRVLDLGCGLGNLSIAAARVGCRVLAVDASAAGVADLGRRAAAEALPLEAVCADLATFVAQGEYDTLVCIGLLMFFDCDTAKALLRRWQARVVPGGTMVVNALIEGTTYLDMFDPQSHCLFAERDIDAEFAGWKLEVARTDEFPALGERIKRFRTVIGVRPH